MSKLCFFTSHLAACDFQPETQASVRKYYHSCDYNPQFYNSTVFLTNTVVGELGRVSGEIRHPPVLFEIPDRLSILFACFICWPVNIRTT